MVKKINFESLKNIWRQPNTMRLVVLGIILGACFLRIKLYSDPAMSIAGNDTQSYVDSSRASLFSKEIFTGRRLFSTNLLYKIFVPDDYEILINGSIATSHLVLQPGFERLVTFQLILSIMGWGFLAFTFAEFIKDPLMKILGAGIMMLFAFTPQMADWDSILMSESPSFSLFALQFALTIWIAFAIYKNPKAKISGLVITWAVVFFFWIFLKDVNLFVTIITLVMIGVLIFFPQYRWNKLLHGTLGFLTLIFLLGMSTSGRSPRPPVQIANLYKDDMLSSPLRVEILQGMGMPEPDMSSPEFIAWLNKNGRSTLAKFMLTHPGYPVTKMLKDFPESFREIKQTYFRVLENRTPREYLMIIGNGFHPENLAPFILSFLLLTGLTSIALKSPGDARPWAWLGLWLFTAAFIVLILTILVDTWGLNRHALYSTVTFRLLMWMLPIIIIDLAIAKQNPKEISPEIA